jgi:hypothetical protein
MGLLRKDLRMPGGGDAVNLLSFLCWAVEPETRKVIMGSRC